MNVRAQLEAAQMRAAEALPDDPVEAARNFREAFRHARGLGDHQCAAAQLTGVAVAHSLLRRRRAAIQVLKLAVGYAPKWKSPHALLGVEFEAQAQLEAARGEASSARLSFLAAAFHMQRASDLAVLEGADDTSAEVKEERERARVCLERASGLAAS